MNCHFNAYCIPIDIKKQVGKMCTSRGDLGGEIKMSSKENE